VNDCTCLVLLKILLGGASARNVPVARGRLLVDELSERPKVVIVSSFGGAVG
jgi:hypothetical protein